MGQDSEQRVDRDDLAARQHHQGQCHAGRDHEDAENEVEVQQRGQGDAKQCRMGHGVAEVGKAPPDDEATQRRRHQRDADPCEKRPKKEIVQHEGASVPLAVGGRTGFGAGRQRDHSAFPVVRMVVMVLVDG